MEDRSSLFNEIQKFSQRKLKKVETNVVTATGDKVVEKRSAKGLQTTDNKAVKNDEGAPKDLQVGLIIPGLMIGNIKKPILKCFFVKLFINIQVKSYFKPSPSGMIL